MNPLVSQFLTAVFRWALQGVFVFFVAKGILTQDQGEAMLIGLVGSLATLAWVLWVKYRDRLKLLTGLASPAGTTQAQVEQKIADGQAPPATLAKDDKPRLEVGTMKKD